MCCHELQDECVIVDVIMYDTYFKTSKLVLYLHPMHLTLLCIDNQEL